MCHLTMSTWIDRSFGDPQWNNDTTDLLQSKLYFNMDPLQRGSFYKIGIQDFLQIRSANKKNTLHKVILKKRQQKLNCCMCWFKSKLVGEMNPIHLP